MTRWMACALGAVTMVCALAGPLVAQATRPAKSYDVLASAGLSRASRSVDSEGWHVEAGVARRLSSRVGARLEVGFHRYGAVDLYPCLVQDAQRCYQTLSRDVVPGIVSLTYQPGWWPGKGIFQTGYLIAGVGVYDSRRIATSYASCQPSGVCDDRNTHTMTLHDTQLGVNGGVGINVIAGNSPMFIEARLHFATRSTPAGTGTNDYFLLPVSLGFRF